MSVLQWIELGLALSHTVLLLACLYMLIDIRIQNGKLRHDTANIRNALGILAHQAGAFDDPRSH